MCGKILRGVDGGKLVRKTYLSIKGDLTVQYTEGAKDSFYHILPDRRSAHAFCNTKCIKDYAETKFSMWLERRNKIEETRMYEEKVRVRRLQLDPEFVDPNEEELRKARGNW
jgi:hypothetical protein